MVKFDFKDELNGILIGDILSGTLEESFEEMPIYEILVNALSKALEKE